MHPNIQSSVTTAKLWKQSKHPSTSEWIKKIWYTPPTHTHTMDYYSDIKKNEVLPFAITWTDLEAIILRETKPKKRNTV